MKVIGSQVLRFVAIAPNLFRPDAVRALAVRYQFVRVPSDADEMFPPNQGDPLTFMHGKLEHDGREILIPTLRVWVDTPMKAISVECAAATDDGDAVIDDLLSLAAGTVRDTGTRRVYASQIEFTMKPWLETRSNLWARTAISLTQRLAKYGGADEPQGAMPPAFRVIQVALRIDPGQWALPTDFRIERRAHTPWESETYYSAAPLRTADHLEVLQEFVQQIEALDRGEVAP